MKMSRAVCWNLDLCMPYMVNKQQRQYTVGLNAASVSSTIQLSLSLQNVLILETHSLAMKDHGLSICLAVATQNNITHAATKKKEKN